MRLVWVQTAFRARAAGLDMLLNTVPEAVVGGRVPQITVVHDLLPLFYPAEYPRQQYYFRSLVPRVLQSSRVVVADSESTRQDVVESYGIAPEKVRVVYPGYDPETYSVDPASRARDATAGSYLLYAGNLLPHKNLLSLLDALAILRRRYPARLVIRGDGQPAYKRAVRGRVETLGLGKAVSFRGYADEGSLRQLYAGAACLVLPSLREGFGLPVLGRHGADTRARHICQGWLRHLLSPTPLVWHNGGTIGSKAVVAFTPDGDLGLVVLSNLDGTDMPEALMYYLYDLYYARPTKDYAGAFLADAKAQAEAGKFPAPPPAERRQH